MEPVTFQPLTRAAICGGTHGNEMSGISIIRELQNKKVEKTGSVSVTPILSNPRAVDACRRYIDTDLNRCFTKSLLSAPTSESSPYELKRAQELNRLVGPKGSPEAMDLVCDLHNTTANMGLTAIMNHGDVIALHIGKYIQSKTTSGPLRIIQIPSTTESYSLESVGKHGISIEVGPQPNGVIRADIYAAMKEAVDLTLEWLQSFNAGTTFEAGEVEVYVHDGAVDYPRDPETQEITAAVHPQLQDNDFKLLQAGDPIFKSFAGETVTYEGEPIYPFFVNECAYYEKKVAFTLAQKLSVSFPAVRVQV
ncbi:N-acyl-aromatic-L-amino acid amidohydrolase (carboxylate-forming) B [Synchiropus splendidus]|uniref:N-acyl-aromatic-L-amino acid amidohydrolase (carboxylate-forming) B n=1 Tax=Synchiropus splendidus TaxID=270530 RepID=UPI00237EE15C|nr:N-acyl-aromatic-L-amino acid amidohydrolase (carboxylate-forming) B [Synchiropus splendidus]XP_053712582.1 N-acyl-aromatic-L-amino acid amidohydrolase (carboxylate-forming) B [Synchiropus splendidus]